MGSPNDKTNAVDDNSTHHRWHVTASLPDRPLFGGAPVRQNARNHCAVTPTSSSYLHYSTKGVIDGLSIWRFAVHESTRRPEPTFPIRCSEFERSNRLLNRDPETKKETLLVRTILLVAVLLGTASCTSSRDAAQEYLPPDFHVEIAEGGGFTGLWQGYAVERDGTVTEWSGTPGNATTRTRRTLAANAVLDLWNAYSADSSLHNQTSDQTGDLTRTLVVTAEKKTVRFSWVPRPSADGTVAALQRYYHFVLQHATAGR